MSYCQICDGVDTHSMTCPKAGGIEYKSEVLSIDTDRLTTGGDITVCSEVVSSDHRNHADPSKSGGCTMRYIHNRTVKEQAWFSYRTPLKAWIANDYYGFDVDLVQENTSLDAAFVAPVALWNYPCRGCGMDLAVGDFETAKCFDYTHWYCGGSPQCIP